MYLSGLASWKWLCTTCPVFPCLQSVLWAAVCSSDSAGLLCLLVALFCALHVQFATRVGRGNWEVLKTGRIGDSVSCPSVVLFTCMPEGVLQRVMMHMLVYVHMLVAVSA